MKWIKYIIPSILMVALLATTQFVFASNTLYEYFSGHLPSIKERSEIYIQNGFNDEYRGTAKQNTSLLFSLENPSPIFGSLAFPPSTVEGTSTAGWTDDGSIVRLNTASDFVGIGTTNPAEKLTVQGGNTYVSGNISFSGGTLTFGSNSGTSTLTVSNSGKLGIGTTTPTSAFSVQGGAFIAGTTTMGQLNATSSIIVNGAATSTFTGNGINLQRGCFAISDTCVISGGSSDWQKLGETIATTSVIVLNVNNFAARQDLKIVLSTKGLTSGGASAERQIRFNNDSGNNYGYRYSLDGGADSITGGSSSIQFNPVVSTTTPETAIFNVTNFSNTTKLLHFESIQSNGAGAPRQTDGVGAWNNSSAQITTVSIYIFTGDTFVSGSRVTVYGKSD